MKASQLVQYLVNIYEAQRHIDRRLSVILLGPPGIGKTASVKQAAQILADRYSMPLVEDGRGDGFHFLAFSVLHLDPIDLSGIPRDSGDGETVVYKPIDVFARLCSPGAKGILFLDEFTLDDRSDRRSALLKLVDEGYLGYRKLSPGVMVVLAGNTTEWSQLAQELDEPMRRGRARIVFVEPPTVDEWVDYMNNAYGEAWDKRIAAYLKLYPTEFFTSHHNGDGYSPLNSPRNFTNLALTLSAVGDEFMEAEVSALCSRETAAKLMTFLTTYIPPVEDVVNSPQSWAKLEREARYLLITQLAGREELDRFAEFFRFLAANDHESLLLLLTLQTEKQRQRLAEYFRRYVPEAFKVLVSIIRHGDEV